MLTLTPTAVEAVRLLTSTSSEPGAGVRITPGEPTPTGRRLQIELASGPGATDQTIAQEGANVYVEPQAAESLDDKVLDATVDSEQVTFSFGTPHDQTGQDSPPT